MKHTENRVEQPLTLPRSRILKGKRNFQRLFKSGSTLTEQHVSLRYVLFNDASEEILIGFITGRRLGKAHERNRVRRRLREAYRLNQNIIADLFKNKPGFHAAFIAHSKEADFSILQEECIQLLKKLKNKLKQTHRI